MRQLPLLLFLIALTLPRTILQAQPGQKQTVYQDVYRTDLPDKIVFGNSQLTLEIRKKDGAWQSLAFQGVSGSLITAKDTLPATDVQVDNKLLVKKNGAALLNYATSIDPNRRGVSLAVTLGIPAASAAKANPGAFAYELTCYYTLYPGESRLDRSAQLRRKSGEKAGSQHMEAFVFQVPGVAVGPPAECVVNVPGPFWPANFIAPETPYTKLTKGRIGFHSAPDAGFGLITLSNAAQNVSLGSFMSTGGEVAYHSALHGDGQRITFQHHDLRAYYLPATFAVPSDTQRIVVAKGGLPAVLKQYRQMVTETMPMEKNTPAWVKDMVLLEVYPKYFPEGFRGITQKLPYYREIGFNTIYLMPHWQGGYSPMDPFKVETAYGTEADLKEMVRKAHELGMKVLFDMVIHGFHVNSPVLKQRPELFVRKENGEMALHPTWGSVSTDWANPAYQRYMADLVTHDLRTYDVDGYRVDAATYKGAGWDPTVHYPAYRSGSAAPELMSRMLQALRQTKPDAVLLSEVFGPVFYSVCNLVHDNQTEALPLLLEKMEKGEYNAAMYKAHLANVYDMLPAGANRVYYSRNHDTSWFYHFTGYTRRFMALDAIHALFAIPEVFAGDPENGPHPDADPGVYGYYKKLFALRKQWPEVARGTVSLREVESSNPWVFSGLRKLDKTTVLGLVSLSDKEETVEVTIQADSIPAPAQMKLQDVQTGESLTLQPKGPRSWTVSLKPYQAVAGKW